MRARLSPAVYAELLSCARRYGTGREDAEDLLQDALLEAVRVGRHDLAQPSGRAWMHGVLRRRAAFLARTAARRRAREASVVPAPGAPAPRRPPWAFVERLPRAQRQVAVLLSAGYGRGEIAHLLGLRDVALRQRLSALRRAWNAWTADDAGRGLVAAEAPTDVRALGLLRRALRGLLQQRPQARLATLDPDGHPLLVRAHVPAPRGN
ncbi:RNA polymerase sigma factor [Coralloluteibacterium thermophilus]|uniref:RNA polymerase sigma factor n=1 Tax=Coralloluteibacterium thermophilum TaxID=2707049 RepID=A0ABV9NKG8_9GAMM